MSPENYIQQLHARLQADGCDPQWEAAPDPLLIGRRSEFRIQWMASTIHLFTIAATAPEATIATLEQFTDYAMAVAIERKKGLPRGIQTGIALFPTVISENVDPAALRRAGQWQKVKFACIARPTVIDTYTRTVGTYRGTPVAGMLYAPYLRKKSERYFPQPE